MNIKKINMPIYVSQNKNDFKKLLGNRDVTNARVAQIKKSIMDVGYVINPIIVNEKMEVIDGQGRLEALSELGLPIYFIKVEGTGIKQCVSMNIKMKNWTFNDYVYSYMTQGYEEYTKLYDAIDRYKNINPANVAAVLEGCSPTGHNFNQIIQNGLFKVENMKKGYTILNFLSDIVSEIKDADCNSSIMLNVLATLAREDLIDMDRMADAIKKYSCLITNGYSVDSSLEILQEIYNHKKRTKFYFRDSYTIKVMGKK